MIDEETFGVVENIDVPLVADDCGGFHYIPGLSLLRKAGLPRRARRWGSIGRDTGGGKSGVRAYQRPAVPGRFSKRT